MFDLYRMQIGWNQPDANPVTICIQEGLQECVVASTAACDFLKELYESVSSRWECTRARGWRLQNYCLSGTLNSILSFIRRLRCVDVIGARTHEALAKGFQDYKTFKFMF